MKKNRESGRYPIGYPPALDVQDFASNNVRAHLAAIWLSPGPGSSNHNHESKIFRGREGPQIKSWLDSVVVTDVAPKAAGFV